MFFMNQSKEADYSSIDTKLKLFVSSLVHFARYKLATPITQLGICMLITSIDIDVGAENLALLNKGRFDLNFAGKSQISQSELSIGRAEEKALPLILGFFNELEIPVTWAIRAQLLDVDNGTVKSIIESSVRHEIASHSFYHSDFKRLTHEEADNELRLVDEKEKYLKYGFKSFIFPKNRIAHLDLLEKYGYECYRGYGDAFSDGMYIKKEGGLYDVHPSVWLGGSNNIKLLIKEFDIAVENKLPFHVWFHPWDIGTNRNSTLTRIRNVLHPFYVYARSQQKEGLVTIETMLSAVEKIKHDSK